jgi:FixJ family two-component response regulator
MAGAKRVAQCKEILAMDFNQDNACRVYIVDDDDSFRNSLARVLKTAGLTSTGYRSAGEYLLAEPADVASCLLLDLCMPGPSGLELLDALAQRETSPPVILVTAYGDVSASVHAIKSGAVDFLTKPVTSVRLLECVRNALALDRKRRAARLAVRALRDRYGTLISIERAVFTGVVNGRLNKQMAADLDTCERTVKAYRARVMSKLQVRSLADLVRAAKVLGVTHSASTDGRAGALAYH